MIALQKKLTPHEAAYQLARFVEEFGSCSFCIYLNDDKDGSVTIASPDRQRMEYPDLYIRPYSEDAEVEVGFQGRVLICQEDRLERTLREKFVIALARVRGMPS